jgi:DNA-binding MarR family transcriptional regulator
MTESAGGRETEVRWLDSEQQRSWRAFVVGTTLLFARLDEDLKKFGLGIGEYEILVRLSESEGGQMRMAQLADAMCHSRSRTTHTVKRMEERGLVRREGAADDGRGVIARLTSAGSDLLVQAAPTHVAGVRQHLVDLCDGSDFAALGRVMNAVTDTLAELHPGSDIR